MVSAGVRGGDAEAPLCSVDQWMMGSLGDGGTEASGFGKGRGAVAEPREDVQGGTRLVEGEEVHAGGSSFDDLIGEAGCKTDPELVSTLGVLCP